MNYEFLVARQRTAVAEIAERLDRLETYLRDDPSNMSLLVEAFETALRCRQWDRAQFHLRHALALDSASLAWQLREADLWLAQEKHEESNDILQRLGAISPLPAGLADALLHDLALIDFQSKNFTKCVARLEARMRFVAQTENGVPDVVETTFPLPLGKLWLRALHHAGEVESAVQWAQHLSQIQRLDPSLAGIASLAALDNQGFSLAREWSAAALSNTQPGERPVEAYVTQASLALAARDAVKARDLASAALQLNPDDGRSWSTYAFADLLAGEPALACSHFERALRTMPGHIGTWHGLGWSQVVQQQLTSAKTSFETALSLDRNFAESHGSLAVVHALEGDAESASFHIERALRLDPGSVTGRFAQSILRGEASNPQAFKRLAQHLLGDQAAPIGGGSVWDGIWKSQGAQNPR